jgi:hypothetical protein
MHNLPQSLQNPVSRQYSVTVHCCHWIELLLQRAPHRFMRRTHPSTPRLSDPAWLLLAFLAGVKLLVHLLTNGNYGIFIDELYYLACADHLDFGYVDHPPGIAIQTWLARGVFGDSLPGLRFIPALFGSATVFITGLIARRLGAGRWGQGMAALAVLASPLYLYMNTILSMNALDSLVWAVAVLLLLRIIDGGGTADWLWLGFVLGVGLENKISVLFLGVGLATGLLLTRHRRRILSSGPWLAAGLAAVLFLPHLLWQVAHDWPTLEVIRNVTELKNRPLPLVEFIATHALEIHPLSFLLSLGGLVFLFFGARGRFRILGWIYLTVVLILVSRNSKPYYLAPAFPMMAAAGAAGLGHLLDRSRRAWPRVAMPIVLALTAGVMAPATLPVLPVETLVEYFQMIGGPPPSGERKDVGVLPQHFADMFGNRETAELVAEVFHALPEEEQARTTIYGMAYPQAAAVDFFGPGLGLPKAVSGHNSYWLWGPGDRSGDPAIVIGLSRESLERLYTEVEVAAVFRDPYAMPWRNNMPIHVCRGIRKPLSELWPEIKHYE